MNLIFCLFVLILDSFDFLLKKNLLQKAYTNPLDGFEISNEEVQLMNEINNSEGSGHNPSIYGEVTTLGARQLFHFMELFQNSNSETSDNYKNSNGNSNIDDTRKNGNHFIDLGSGNGKLVVQAYLEIPNLNRAEGIELSSARHENAISSWSEIREEAKVVRNQMKELSSNTGGDVQEDDERIIETELNLLQGDLFQMDISTATHIYIASLCFTDEMMDALSAKISKEGGEQLQYVATLKPFPTDFEMNSGLNRKEAKYVEMSWTKPRGMGGVVYFYSKV